MKFSYYVYLWIILTILAAIEYFTLNNNLNYSVLNYIQQNFPRYGTFDLSTEPGKPISYFLGWSGLSIMGLTNIYLLRKRVHAFKKIGHLPNWLNFQIFCGLFGPTLIIFHTDFKIGGLVAISFWSMMTVAISGVIGRYFYIQVLKKKSEVSKTIQKIEDIILQAIQSAKIENKEDTFYQAKKNTYNFIGVKLLDSPSEKNYSFSDLIVIFFRSIIGDIKGFFAHPKSLPGLPKDFEVLLSHYAAALRQEQYYTPFQTLLGYWHSFHVPFAVIMYVVALIHVVVALLFQV